ncbi:hypothetical protein [Paraburkholderia sp. MM5384-R2]|uniref:hypothetical protein n=1 Tax=Paraburkholderia sp. MM5384-R2 TaxID=2723097 RepID=UPI00162086C5|nr:hypothetical protein [Paraburkholderia sp. MM5384-R2]MBB5501193.1 hypothetical protein [Paraburkholderia sp. MM5384-R2]
MHRALDERLRNSLTIAARPACKLIRIKPCKRRVATASGDIRTAMPIHVPDDDQTARERYDEAARRYDAARHRFPFDLADVIRPELDKPAFTVPDATPVHRHPRTDFGALRGSLRV